MIGIAVDKPILIPQYIKLTNKITSRFVPTKDCSKMLISNNIPLKLQEFEETLRSWNELKQGKVIRLDESLSVEEEELLNPLLSSVLSLVRG